jgi:hypothetical protein
MSLTKGSLQLLTTSSTAVYGLEEARPGVPAVGKLPVKGVGLPRVGGLGHRFEVELEESEEARGVPAIGRAPALGKGVGLGVPKLGLGRGGRRLYADDLLTKRAEESEEAEDVDEIDEVEDVEEIEDAEEQVGSLSSRLHSEILISYQ